MDLKRQRENRIIFIKKNPWLKHLYKAKQRCVNPNATRYPCYGGRGIKFLLNKEEIKTLWFRDKAYLLIKPSIDRKNNDGHYEFSNCRFIEYSKNLRSYK